MSIYFITKYPDRNVWQKVVKSNKSDLMAMEVKTGQQSGIWAPLMVRYKLGTCHTLLFNYIFLTQVGVQYKKRHTTNPYTYLS